MLQFQSNCLNTIEQIRARSEYKNSERKWNPTDREFEEKFNSIQNEVRERLRDNFDTAGAIKQILDLVKETNKYMQIPSETGGELPLASLPSRVLAYITEMFEIWGATFLGKQQEVGEGILVIVMYD
jgi:cysteinyl-tRNA synthetase